MILPPSSLRAARRWRILIERDRPSFYAAIRYTQRRWWLSRHRP